MNNTLRPDLCIIGAGSGGLSVAAGAAQMGASVVLVEKGEMGGDCLNTGCVPSKALLAAAHVAHTARNAARLGINTDVRVDGARVFAHVQSVIDGIAPHDSQQRFEALGCTVIRDSARFTGHAEVQAGGHTVRARRFVIATGSHPVVPPVPGLAELNPLTNESLFTLGVVPKALLVVGGGPIGCEMAQAFARLGAEVTVVEMQSILPKDDPAMVAVVRDALVRDGVRVLEGVKVVGASGSADAPVLDVEHANGARETLSGTHLLVAAGRRPTVDGLGLQAAGVAVSPAGITVDAGLKTTNRKIYAIGDVTGGLQFTHVANAHAGVVIRNALFRLPAKVNRATIPWVTYTDPELATVGMSEATARERFGDNVRVLEAAVADNDRARAEGDTMGQVKVVTQANGRLLGASIVGAQAGELIQPWVLALENALKIKAMATTVAPYPTRGEINKHAAGSFYTPSLYGRKTRWLVRLLSRLG